MVVSIKNEDSSQPSTPSPTFVSIVHTFYGNWWQRGRDCDKDMKIDELDMVDMDQEGATLKNGEGSKFLDNREAHK